MSNFKSAIKLFVLALLVLAFSGCGGGGSSDNNVSSNPNTTPAPNYEQNTIPNTDNNSYNDTYDIVSALNGTWIGVNGSGTANGRSGAISALMSSMNVSIVNAQVSGNTGTLYITCRQNWNYEFKGYGHNMLLYCDAEKVNMLHVGSDTWLIEGWNGSASVTVMLTSQTTAIITQQGTVNTEDGTYSYSARLTAKKQGGSNNPSPNSPNIDTPNTKDETDYTNTYDINSVLNGTWYGDSGSGTATGAGETFNLVMNRIQIRIFNTQVNGNTGTTYISHRQYWDYDDNYSDYITRVQLYGDGEKANITHTGNNTWHLTFSNDTTVTIMFINEREAMVTQEGTTDIDNTTYSYSLRYTMSK